MRIIIVDIFEFIEEQSHVFLQIIIGLILLGLSLIMLKCLVKPQPVPDNNSGFDFVKEGKVKFETNSNTKVTTEANNSTRTTSTTTRNSTSNTRSQNSERTNTMEQTDNRPHNLYYCTTHEKYFGYNEQSKHYECKNAIKKINVKFCWECQKHYGPTERMIHFGHGLVPYVSDKANYQKFYCDTCGFYHYKNQWIKR